MAENPLMILFWLIIVFALIWGGWSNGDNISLSAGIIALIVFVASFVKK